MLERGALLMRMFLWFFKRSEIRWGRGEWTDVKRGRERGLGGFSKDLVGAVVGGLVDEDGGKMQIVPRIAWGLKVVVV